uniref:NADH dehydrogenase [ubiquinone] 1 alpha subcomplex subunit 3 n=1 Tax=Fundulus heteroclitus TaxID=8078 RepID=A0A3Q2Q4L0_FUNHE
MAGIGAFLRNAWNKEPVITVACGIGLVGMVLPFVSPYTKYTAMMNSIVPYTYPGKLSYVNRYFTKVVTFFELLRYECMSQCSCLILNCSFAVPVRDDGNMPDVPSHPCEAKGRSLEWFKNM